VDSLIGGLEQIVGYNDIFGGPSLSFGPEKRAGGDSLVLVQNQGGAWVKVQDGLAY
jgi:branched-chain amino acid transport system substrate-binding protein